MQIKAVKVRRLYLEVAKQLKQAILAGELKPGDRLPPERDLAQRFEVSRPTIREAMIALEIDGQIEVRRGTGSFVCGSSPARPLEIVDEGPGPFEILEARRVIEAETAALAAARITPDQVAALEATFDEMAQEDAHGSVSEAADRAFHCLIAEASQNSALASTVNWLWELRNRSGISRHFHQRVREGGVHPSLEHHRNILMALKSRDPIGAQKAMVDHLSDAIAQNMEWLDKS